MADRAVTEELAARLMGKPFEEMSADECEVLERVVNRAPISRSPDEMESNTFWDRLADRVAAVGGSWAFIGGFAVVLFGWMLLNSEVLNRFGAAFDPYPFIFLNLMLSTLAAIQAPVIMMSQNRQSAKDRAAAQHDYQVNLRAELEILLIHEKLELVREEQRLIRTLLEAR